MPTPPTLIPVVFPTDKGECPKCGYPANYPGSSQTPVVSIYYNSTINQVEITCNICRYSVYVKPAS